MHITIRNSKDTILFHGEAASYREAIAKILAGRRKNLSGLYVPIRTDLAHQNFSKRNLQRADFSGANLLGCNFEGADLRGADFQNTLLDVTRFKGAKIKDVRWPAPPMILLAYWGTISDKELLTDLLVYDMVNHPDPKTFKTWVRNGTCPFTHCNYQRAALFSQERYNLPDNWWRRKPKSALNLVQRLFALNCITE